MMNLEFHRRPVRTSNDYGQFIIFEMSVVKGVDFSDAQLDSYRFLVHANDKSEQLWISYSRFMLTVFIETEIITAISIFSRWFAYGDFEATNLYHPFKVV